MSGAQPVFDADHGSSRPPAGSHPVVFLGDSITEESPWATAFDGVTALNHGVSGERTYHVAARLGATIAAQPRQVFLLIGINDLLGDGAAPVEIARRVHGIVETLRRGCPRAEVFVVSILPIRAPAPTNEAAHRMVAEASGAITETNALLKDLAAELGVTYLDLHSAIADDDGFLPAAFTEDGLHLTAEGYRATIALLAPHVSPGE